MPGLVHPGLAIAVIPTVVSGGPLALLALLFPAVSAALALRLRRWLVLLAVASLGSTLYLVHAWFWGSWRDSWWGRPPALWATLALVALAGALWSGWRQRAALRVTPEATPAPGRGELLVLWAVSLLGLGLLLYCLGRGTVPPPPWQELLALAAVAWVGALYASAVRLLAGRRPAAARVPTTECVLLGALACACVGLAAASRPPPPPAAPAVAVAWVFEPPQRGAIVSSPLVAGDRVYVAAIRDAGFSPAGAVYCLDRATGRVRWHFDDGGGLQHMYSSPCLAQGCLYLGEGMHANLRCKFYCLDAATGRKRWHFETAGHIESSPCVANGQVFFGAGAAGVYCLDAATGARRWQFRAALHVDASPAVVGRRLYAGSGVSRSYRAPEVFCLDTDTGRALWRVPTPLPAWGSPAPAGDDVFFGLGNGRLTGSATFPEKPAGALLCVDGRTGRTRWRYDVGDGVLAQPTVAPRHVYFGARDGCCYCLERAAGRLCWQTDLGSPLVTRLARAGHSLYAAASAGRVCRLDADRGTPGWTFDVAAHSGTRPRLFSSPAVAAGPGPGGQRDIYFGTELRNPVTSAAVLYCLRDLE
jgi:outer membrane protein assembly factor BamB